MARRRGLREVVKRIRAFSAQAAAEASGSKAPIRPARGSHNWAARERVLPPSEFQQQKGTSVAAWLLAAGGATAFSALSASAGSTISTEAPVTPAAPLPKTAPPSQDFKVVFVLGGPGSGKGTQCAKIVDEFGFTHLSAGDLLRAEVKSGSEYGNMINGMIKEGKIVPAEVTVNLLRKAMQESGNDKFLIDGFPRNKENREVFERDTGISPEFILFFDCPEAVMEKRLLSRNQGRVDDNIETIRKRFHVFIEQSMPVVEHYEKSGKVYKIDATKTPDEVFKSYSRFFIRFIEA